MPRLASTSRPFISSPCKPIAWAAAFLCACIAQAEPPVAQEAVNAMALKNDWQLHKAGLKGQSSNADTSPIFIEADHLSGVAGESVVLSGGVRLRSSDVLIKADNLEYRQADERAIAKGDVRIFKDGNRFTGDELNLQVQNFSGYMTQPTYEFAVSQGGGKAERIDFLDKDHATVRKANYTTCKPKPQKTKQDPNCSEAKPAWELRAAQVDFDNTSETGLAHDVQLRFMDVPILAAPVLSFPLTDKRKSGLLPPAIALDSTSGFEYTQPVYWNIAPQMDATFYPSLMSKRGLNLGNEFRYLGQKQEGAIRADFMPSDKLRGRNRWGLSGDYVQRFTPPVALTPRDTLTLRMNLNRVSDGNYWRDFSDIDNLTQRMLANDSVLAWQSDKFYAQVRALKWQTQQTAESVVTPPYNRLPSLTVGWRDGGISGFAYSAEVDNTKFESDTVLNAQPNARRTVAKAELSYALRQPGWFVVPKVQLQMRNYQFDSPLTTGETQRSLSVPTVSVDSGILLERTTSYWNKSYVQTLEPRAFYTYTPFREQNTLPNYDSGLNDFNFASIYSANAFNGEDRIADNNLLTVGVQSRLIKPENGAEVLRLSYAQRLRYKDRKVVLPGGAPDNARFSDMLFGAQANLSKKWSADAVVQYNPKTNNSERSSIGVRYHPSDYRTLSMAYRYQRTQSELLDVGWQWPLNNPGGASKKQPALATGGLGEGRWYSVGRINYSAPEKKIIDSLVGFEYDGGCWVGRVALERRSNTVSQSSKRILFQLEFVGFSKIGASPLQALQDAVPRYRLLREKGLGTKPASLDYE